nr:hypothetical protein CFP56_74365 [Quercus suber]
MQVDERLSKQRTDKEALRYLRSGGSVTRHLNLYFLNNLGDIDGAPPSANGEGRMVVKVKDDVAGVSVDISGREMVETVTLDISSNCTQPVQGNSADSSGQATTGTTVKGRIKYTV